MDIVRQLGISAIGCMELEVTWALLPSHYVNLDKLTNLSSRTASLAK